MNLKMKTQSKHTPGPWLVRCQGYRLTVFHPTKNSDHVIVRQVEETSTTVDQPDRKPFDAALISAAPELLEALEHLVALLEPLEDSGALNVPGLATLNGARKALAKASGEGGV